MRLRYLIKEEFQLKIFLINQTMSKNKTLKIKQIKSSIGYKNKAKLTLKALGLKKLNQIVEHQDTPELRGMLNVVSYLVKIEDSK